jgi:predicted nucleic acid-binding protein
LVASRLLEYEVWTRLHARGLARSHAAEIASLMARISLVELSPVVLARALEAFPMPLRTLDALHLATVEFLRSRGRDVALASYDERLLAVARSLAIPLFDA